MKFIDTSSYWLFDDVKDGKIVFALDKQLKKIEVVNYLTVDQLVAVMKSAETEPTRYEFWYKAEESDVTKATEETKINTKWEEDDD